MKKNFINREFIEGRLYQHNLTIKQVQNKDSANYGKDFISGTLDIATDEEGLNVISIHFTYVTEVTNSGKVNVTYGVLKSIIDGAKAWITDGKEQALKLRVNTALALNDFYTQDGSLVSAKRNEGGFVNTVTNLVPEPERNRFDLDLVITSVNRVIADEEKGIDNDFLTIKGACFNFRNDLLPIEFTCRREDGMGYFESLDASPSNHIFTRVKGAINSTTVKHEIAEESAFGTASVRTVTRTTKEWCIDWANPTEYDFGAEDTLTADELRKMMQDREVYLADIKKRHDDYIKNRDNSFQSKPASTSTSVPTGEFDF